jgi:hypothetical protein
LGIYQFKVRQALEMYQAGVGSLGYVAEKVGLFKQDLIREARARGIEPPFDEQTVQYLRGEHRYLCQSSNESWQSGSSVWADPIGVALERGCLG